MVTFSIIKSIAWGVSDPTRSGDRPPGRARRAHDAGRGSSRGGWPLFRCMRRSWWDCKPLNLAAGFRIAGPGRR